MDLELNSGCNLCTGSLTWSSTLSTGGYVGRNSRNILFLFICPEVNFTVDVLKCIKKSFTSIDSLVLSNLVSNDIGYPKPANLFCFLLVFLVVLFLQIFLGCLFVGNMLILFQVKISLGVYVCNVSKVLIINFVYLFFIK